MTDPAGLASAGGVAAPGGAPAVSTADGLWPGLRQRLGRTEPHKGGRFASLDGFRAIAAIGVVVYHVAGYSQLTSSNTLVSKFLNNLGNFGVATFFLLSGFLLYRPFVMKWFQDQPPPDPIIYLRHRFLRIFPAYWVALGAFILLGLVNAKSPAPDYFFTLFSLTQIYRPAYGFAGLSVAWTLAIEISFYIALPFIAAGIRLIGRNARTLKMKLEAQLLGLATLAAITLIYRAIVAGPWQYDAKAHPFATVHLWLFNYFDWFALGMVLAVFVCWTDLGRTLPALFQRFTDTGWACWICAAACYFILMLLRDNAGAAAAVDARETTLDMFIRFFFNGMAAFFFLLPGIIGRTRTSYINRGLASTVPMYLGTVSYGIYLWHKIWLDYLKGDGKGVGAAPTHPSFWAMLAMVLTLSVITASISYYALERPIMKFRDPRRLRSRAKTTAPG